MRRPPPLHRALAAATAAPRAVRAAAASSVPGGVHPDAREDVARVLELADRAASSWSLLASDFLRPPSVAAALAALAPLAGVAGVPFGGHGRAERARLIVGRDEDVAGADVDADLAPFVAAVRVRGVFAFDAASHRDFLGAALGTAGLDRRVLGDVVVTGDRGCVMFATPTAADVLAASLTRVRTVPVRVETAPLTDLDLPEPTITQLKSYEASTRLDAIAAAGFRVPRSKLVDAIRRGDVRLNWREAKAMAPVRAGDVITMAGKGRVNVVGIEETKRGRYAVELQRLV